MEFTKDLSNELNTNSLKRSPTISELFNNLFSSTIAAPAALSLDPEQAKKENALIQSMAESYSSKMKHDLQKVSTDSGTEYKNNSRAREVLNNFSEVAYEAVASGAYDKYIAAAEKGRSDLIESISKNPKETGEFAKAAFRLELVNDIQKLLPSAKKEELGISDSKAAQEIPSSEKEVFFATLQNAKADLLKLDLKGNEDLAPSVLRAIDISEVARKAGELKDAIDAATQVVRQVSSLEKANSRENILEAMQAHNKPLVESLGFTDTVAQPVMDYLNAQIKLRESGEPSDLVEKDQLQEFVQAAKAIGMELEKTKDEFYDKTFEDISRKGLRIDSEINLAQRVLSEEIDSFLKKHVEAESVLAKKTEFLDPEQGYLIGKATALAQLQDALRNPELDKSELSLEDKTAATLSALRGSISETPTVLGRQSAQTELER